MARARIRNSESCVSGHLFLIENNVVFVLFLRLKDGIIVLHFARPKCCDNYL